MAVVAAGCSEPEPPQRGDRCESIQDCLGGEPLVCVDGACALELCDLPADCPLEATCLQGICKPAECGHADDCAQAPLCWQGICVQGGCESRAACAPDEVCLGQPPVCGPPPERCTEDLECPLAHRCILSEGRCTPTCDADSDCSSPAYCLNGVCQPPCRDHRECSADRACFEGRCTQLPDCSGRPECSGLLPYRDPLTCECAMCLSSADCDQTRQEICSEQGRCLVCTQPAASADACADDEVFRDGCCAECLQDEDCAEASRPYCHRGRCESTPRPECVAATDCTDDDICDRGWCVRAPSFDDCQAQADCPATEACYADGLCRARAQVCSDCPEPSRCVAEPGDSSGTCAGCTNHCSADACPDAHRCFIPDDQPDGYCVQSHLLAECSN